jgi:hypothetical protein
MFIIVDGYVVVKRRVENDHATLATTTSNNNSSPNNAPSYIVNTIPVVTFLVNVHC